VWSGHSCPLLLVLFLTLDLQPEGQSQKLADRSVRPT